MICRLGPVPEGPRPDRLLRRRALLRWLRLGRGLCAAAASRRRPRPAPTASCSATRTAARFTSKLVEAVRAARGAVDVTLGIHTHNDAGLAVANYAGRGRGRVHAGAGLRQRLRRKLRQRRHADHHREPQAQDGPRCRRQTSSSRRLTEASHYVNEVVNFVPNPYQPYVGASAFSHKAGLHAAGVIKKESSYQHIQPEVVGNQASLLVSELGRQPRRAREDARCRDWSRS